MESAFPIHYIVQPNGGKHSAHNMSLPEARGRLFISIDSDDACVPEALEYLNHYWNTIPFGQQPAYAGCCTCALRRRRRVGSSYPAEVMDTNHLEMVYRQRMRGTSGIAFAPMYCVNIPIRRLRVGRPTLTRRRATCGMPALSAALCQPPAAHCARRCRIAQPPAARGVRLTSASPRPLRRTIGLC